jgi:hypothetical protein
MTLNRSRLISLGAIPFVLTACGTFQLADGIYPPPGKTSEQQQTDILACKDQARLEANTADRQAGAFLLGMTIIGAPVAFELEKAKQREVFSQCMTARGYRIVPSTDDVSNAAALKPSNRQTAVGSDNTLAPNTQAEQRAALAAPPAVTSRDAVTQLEQLKALRDRGLITEEDYTTKKSQILEGL